MATEIYAGYKEKKGSGPESYNVIEGSFQATRIFIGPWSRRHEFIFDYLLEFDGVDFFPRQYDAAPLAYVEEIEIEGLVGGADANEENFIEYDYAVITVTYRNKRATPPNKQQQQSDQERWINSVFLEEELDSDISIFLGERTEFRDEEGGNPLDVVVPVQLPVITATIVVTNTFVVRPYWLEMGALAGSINERAFIFPSGFVAPKNTLRYDGPFGQTKVNVVTGGGINDQEEYPLPIWSISQRFSFDKHGHNTVIEENGDFKKIQKADGKPMFDEGNFWAIFYGFDSARFVWNGWNDTLDDIDEQWDIIVDHVNNGGKYTDAVPSIAAATINGYVRALGFRI